MSTDSGINPAVPVYGSWEAPAAPRSKVTDTSTDKTSDKPSKKAGAESTTEQAASARQWDWSWRHGPVIGPVNAAGGLAGAVMVADLAGVSPVWGAAAGAAAAGAVTVRAATRQISRLGLAWRSTCWVTAGGWATWALASSPWSPDVLAGLAVGTVAAGLAAPAVTSHEARVTGRRQRAARVAAAVAEARAEHEARVERAIEWTERLARVCRIKGHQVEVVESWPVSESGRPSAGYTVQVRLAGGNTWQQIAGFSVNLASDADLPAGCGVEVSGGGSRAVALIRVSTIDTTAEERAYPEDYSPLSFGKPLPIGMYRDDVQTEIELLDDPALVAGRRGSGKTNALQVINLGALRCVDCVVWHIDLNGSGMSRPWLKPWLSGLTARPVLDWVAATPEEALLMVLCAIKIAETRKGAYQERQEAVDDDKLPIGPDVPAILIVLDEGAEAVAASRGLAPLSAAFEKLISISRASRVQLVLSGVRATSAAIPTALKKQTGTRMVMRPENKDDIGQTFDNWNSGATTDDTPWPGSGLITSAMTSGITPWRSYRLRPSQIQESVIAVGPLRPYLDPISAQAAGKTYAERWQRYLSWLTKAGSTNLDKLPPVPADSPAAEPRTIDLGTQAPATTQEQGPAAAQAGGLENAAARLAERRERLRRVREEADKTDADFAAIVSAEWGTPTSDNTENADEGPDEESDPASDAKAKDEQTRVMLRILRGAGSAGMLRDDLVVALEKVGINPSRATIYRWLKEAAEAGQIVPIEGPGSRWAATGDSSN